MLHRLGLFCNRQTFIIFKILFNNEDTSFLLTLNSQLSNCSFVGGCCQQLNAKMAANSNLALTLGHPLIYIACFKYIERYTFGTFFDNLMQKWRQIQIVNFGTPKLIYIACFKYFSINDTFEIFFEQVMSDKLLRVESPHPHRIPR